MKNFFSNSIPLITLAGLLLLLPVGWAQAVTTRVSVDSAGGQANHISNSPSISADGRYVAFVSLASNLVAGDTNNAYDIFVHDRQTAITTRVSVDSSGEEANNVSYNHPSISADGRYVAFASFASNLVAADTNGETDVFVHDRQIGTTTRINVDSAGQQANGGSNYSEPALSLSADGRYVAFTSYASNLVPGDTNNASDVFVHDRQTATTTRISVDNAGNQLDSGSAAPSISADGRFVAFLGPNNSLFLYNNQSGTTTRVYGGVTAPSISANGRFVAFSATGPFRGRFGYFAAIYVYDRLSVTTELLGGGWEGRYSTQPSISSDGRFVALVQAQDLGRELSSPDIFVLDRLTGATTHVSGAQSLFDAPPSISADGRFVAFESRVTNLVLGDTNGVVDIFVNQLPCDSDVDCDGIPDTMDNCIYQQNGPLAPGVGSRSQRDTNGDGFGNVCDADLNNNGLVTAADYAILRSRLNTADPDADLNGDGRVTSADYQILRGLLNKTPGPSGLVP